MASPAPEPIAAPEGARCSLHPDRPALLACHRCGAFICEDDQRPVDGALYCPPCAARPDVDYLDAFRLKYWGVRDSWAWLFGFGALFNAALAVLTGTKGGWVPMVVFGLSAGAGISFFTGARWARYGPLTFSVLMLLYWAVEALQSRSGPGATFGAIVAAFVVLVTTGVFFDTRNRLFFKVPVSRRALHRSWHLYANNVVARQGFQLSLLGILVPGVALVGLLVSIAGLRRVDPHAHPPVGRRGQAIAGIVLSAAGVLAWGFVLLAAVLESFR